MNIIKFYRPSDLYGCFSNFSPHGFRTNNENIYWRTSEHYFQAKKFEGTDFEEIIRSKNTPREAASLGRKRFLPLRKDWEDIKEKIMYDALSFKFSQHDNIREILLSTGDAYLVEDSPIDYYWGCGKDNTGKNRLGCLLMKLRQEFQKGSNNDL